MLRELISILRGDNPMGDMGRDFARMMSLTAEMAHAAGDLYFENVKGPEARERIYASDREVNEFQRAIRRLIVAHLTVAGNTADVPYCLALMSLVKDVERLGDYAKNIAEVEDFRTAALPDDEQTRELQSIRRAVEGTFQAIGEVWSAQDKARALTLISEGRGVAKRCEALIRAISASRYDANTTAVLVLGARYYKRVGGHLLNVLSAIVMPLDKLDYYDEDDPAR